MFLKGKKAFNRLRNRLGSRPGSPVSRGPDDQGLAAPPIESRRSFQDHLVVTNPSSEGKRVARSASLEGLSTSAQPNPTVEEAKAQADKHSPLYDHSMTVFNGFASLVKKVEPFLEGTPFKSPAAVFIAIVEAFEVSTIKPAMLPC